LYLLLTYRKKKKHEKKYLINKDGGSAIFQLYHLINNVCFISNSIYFKLYLSWQWIHKNTYTILFPILPIQFSLFVTDYWYDKWSSQCGWILNGLLAVAPVIIESDMGVICVGLIFLFKLVIYLIIFHLFDLSGCNIVEPLLVIIIELVWVIVGLIYSI
jgi:hypothetical protein